MRTAKEEKVEHVLDIAVKAYLGLLPTDPSELPLPDLTMPQFRIAVTLFLCGPTRMSSIARTLNTSLATATGIVDRLVEQDIVQRQHDLQDRRVVLCELTTHGKDRLGETWQSFRNRAREILKEIPEADLSSIGEALILLLKAGKILRTTEDSECDNMDSNKAVTEEK
jgi:MarR family 2-MHQ and catechol resistance regulon transcriptional repressor